MTQDLKVSVEKPSPHFLTKLVCTAQCLKLWPVEGVKRHLTCLKRPFHKLERQTLFYCS